MKNYSDLCAGYVKKLAVVSLVALTTTHCANTEDGRLAQGQGTAIGALGGAALGAGIGALTGNSDTVLKGALIGSAAGGAIGFGYGSHIANKKAQYKSTEEWLDACIVQAEAKRKQAVAYNNRLENQLARLEKEVRMAKAAGDRKKLASLNREIVSESKGAKQEVAAYSKEAQLQRNAIQQAGGSGGSRLKTLRTSTSGIETQVSTMNKNVQRYAALESQTDV